MCRKALSLPCQDNSWRLTPLDIAQIAGDDFQPQEDPDEYLAWVTSEYAHTSITHASATGPFRVDLRPRDALARAFS